MNRILKLILKAFLSSEKTHFLIVLQNNNELRSTGGYITAVLDVKLGRGRLKKKFLNVNTDLYKHEKTEAPKIIQQMLFDSYLNTWTFRDANYDPDFEKSAEKMTEFYNKVYPYQKVNGLLAVNFSFVEDFLDLIGKIKVRDEWIDSKNLFEYLTVTVSDIDRHDLKALENRKSILRTLAKKLVLELAKKPWKWVAFMELARKGFLNKDLQLYDPKKEISNFKAEKGQDFFALIENNYLGLKSNRYTHRSIQHDSFIGKEGQVKNQVAIRWHHFGGDNYPLSGKYRSHMRIYLNKESVIPNSEGYDVQKEGDFKIMSFKMELEPREAKEIYFEYELPGHFCQNEYQFSFFKQPGVKNESLKKTICLDKGLDFADAGLLDCNEEISHKEWPSVKTDICLQTSFKKSQKHPRIHMHEIISEDFILLKFNEPVQVDQAEIEVYEKASPQEKLEIDSVRLLKKNQYLLIKVKDLPRVEEGFYVLRIKNVFNLNNRCIQPNPRNLTVVYRSRNFGYWKRIFKGFI